MPDVHRAQLPSASPTSKMNCMIAPKHRQASICNVITFVNRWSPQSKRSSPFCGSTRQTRREELPRKHGVSDARIRKWKKVRLGGIAVLGQATEVAGGGDEAEAAPGEAMPAASGQIGNPGPSRK